VAEDVNNIIKESIDSVLLNQGYEHQKVRLSLRTSIERSPGRALCGLWCVQHPTGYGGRDSCVSVPACDGWICKLPLAHPPRRATHSERMAVVVGRQVGQWTSQVVESCMKRLTGLNKPFKYVGECRPPLHPAPRTY
jgi:hypothetical protein